MRCRLVGLRAEGHGAERESRDQRSRCCPEFGSPWLAAYGRADSARLRRLPAGRRWVDRSPCRPGLSGWVAGWPHDRPHEPADRRLRRRDAWYDAVLAPLGFRGVMDFERCRRVRPGRWSAVVLAGCGDRSRRPAGAYRLQRRGSGRGAGAVHQVAVGLGGEVLHEPRVWPEYHPDYFGAFVRDPDGNNVEAVCHRPGRMTGTVRRVPHPPRPTPPGRKAAPQPVAAAAGERLWFLDPPFRTPLPGARFDRARKAWVYAGAGPAGELGAVRGPPLQPAAVAGGRGQRRRRVQGSCGVAPKIPRPDPVIGAAMIDTAAADGWRQFLLCDDVGTGKTITLWLGALRRGSDLRRRADAAGSWCWSTVRPRSPFRTGGTPSPPIGDGGHRVLISSPDQLPKLLSRNGRPWVALGHRDRRRVPPVPAH